MRPSVRKCLSGFLLAYVGVLALVFVFQRTFVYVPNGSYAAPSTAEAPSPFRELAVRTEDGIELKGWYAPATARKLSLIYFHGNADNIENVIPIAMPYIAAGYGFLVVEYRGYSGFAGEPTEDGLYADARAFVRALIGAGVKENEIVLMGHSLGTGVATQMAGEFSVAGLILLAPYLSMSDMAQIRFPYLPARYLALDRYDNADKIQRLHLPVFIATGGKDVVVPPSHGKALFALANEPKQFYFSPDKGHSDMYEGGLFPATGQWLQELRPKAP